MYNKRFYPELSPEARREVRRISGLRLALHSKLYHIWGPDDNWPNSKWPVSWDDIHPSVELWDRDGFGIDAMVGFVQKCVQILQAA